MKIYKVKTPYECLIKCNGEETLLEPNETLELSGRALVYPIDSDVLPFSLDTENLASSQFYDSLEELGIVFLKNSAVCENYTITKLDINGDKCIFEIGENKIIISYKAFKKIVHLQNNFNTFKLGNKHNIAYIHLKGKTDALYALNIKTGKLKQFSGETIEISNEGFIIKNESDCEYKITTEGLTKQTSPKLQPLTNEATPYCFLDALQHGEYGSAYELCSPTLQQQINKEALKDFFGQISNFYTLTPYKYAVKSDSIRVYTFDVNNKQIVEINN